MKLPSLNAIVSTTTKTIQRFPLSIISALLFTLLCWLAIDDVDVIRPGHVFAAVLGLSLFLGIDLLAERTGSRPLRLTLSILGLVGLGLYGWVLLGDWKDPDNDMTQLYRFGLFLVATHLFVAIAPFIRRGSVRAFWEFNKSLFLRFLLAALFSGVLAAGLAIAMLAVDQLLLGGHVVREDAYAKLCLVIGGLFNTIFFLADIPTDFDALEGERPYPKGLKIFAQNLLLPLVVLYMSILYAYAVTILVKWEWPQGWIGWLVLSFSVLGILALLLLHPLRDHQESNWIKRFSRWFYVAVLPLIGLLFAAAMRRIGEYGITENRYFILLLACWLGGVSLYFIISPRKNIKIIPISLAAVALFSSFGPWGAFSVSTNSQVNRLEALMIKSGMLANGKVDPEKGKKVNDDDRSEMRSIIYYLRERGELERVVDLAPEGNGTEKLAATGEGTLLDQLGLSSADVPGGPLPGQMSFGLPILPAEPSSESFDIRGFDLMYRNSYNFYNMPRHAENGGADSVAVLSYGGREYRLLLRRTDPLLILADSADTVLTFAIAPVIAPDVSQNMKKGDDTVQVKHQWLVEGAGHSLKGRVIVSSVSGYYGSGAEGVIPKEITVENMAFTLLLAGGSVQETP